MNLEPVAVADLVAITAIERQSFADPWSTASFASMMGRDEISFLVARDSAATPVLGYVVAIFAGDEGEIGNLAVAESAQGHGVGLMLVQRVVDEARARGVRSLYLEVRESNEAARRLYKRSGFGEVGRRKGYYQHPVEDALVLRRAVDSAPE